MGRVDRFIEILSKPRRCPQSLCKLERIDDAVARPPRALVASLMNGVMVDGAQRDGELIRYLEPHGTGLCKPKVVSVGGSSAAHQARLLGNEG